MDADNSPENDPQSTNDNDDLDTRFENEGEMDSNSPMTEGDYVSIQSPDDSSNLEQMSQDIPDVIINLEKDAMVQDDSCVQSPSQDAEMTQQPSSDPVDSNIQSPFSPKRTSNPPKCQEPDCFSSQPVKSDLVDSVMHSSDSDNDRQVNCQNSDIQDLTADNQMAKSLSQTSDASFIDREEMTSHKMYETDKSKLDTEDNKAEEHVDSCSDETGEIKYIGNNQENEASVSSDAKCATVSSINDVLEIIDQVKVADSTQNTSADGESNTQENLEDSNKVKCDTIMTINSKVSYAEVIESSDESLDNSSVFQKLEAGAEPIESDESDSEILHMPDQYDTPSIQYAKADSNQVSGNKCALYGKSGKNSQLPDASGYNSADDTLDLEANSPSEHLSYDSYSGKNKNIPSEDDEPVTGSGQTDYYLASQSVNRSVSVEKSSMNGDCKNVTKTTANTSFNEEHLELDYDEDVEDGQRSEHEEGEMRSDDEDDMDKSDDGEIDDDEDCEEGEIREPGSKKPFMKPTCRFFVKGHCTWGENCRFLHPGVNDKGNYSLIERPGFNVIMGPRGQYGSKQWPVTDMGPPPEPEMLPPPPPEVPVVETAWERGLRQAKEMKKKASERKETEVDFEEKRLNLKMDDVPDKEFNKENEKFRYKDPFFEQGYEEPDEYYDRPPVHGFQAGQFENFEVRWTRGPELLDEYREKDRFKEKQFLPSHVERLYNPDPSKIRPEPRDPRDPRDSQPPQPLRGRADEWRDPWQRSKSPIKKKVRTSRPRRRRRTHSGSSSSSLSSSGSRSYSSNSFSSGSSYSRSSSFSRSSRSRSRSPGLNRRPLPNRVMPGRNFPPQRPIDRRGGESVHPHDSRPPVPLRNMEPRSSVTVKPQPPDRRRPPPALLPLTQKNVQAVTGKKARRPRTGSHSSSGSSSSHTASSFSSHTSSSSHSSSGSADSQHLYRDIDSTAKHGGKSADGKTRPSTKISNRRPVSTTDPRLGPAGKGPRQAGRPEVQGRQGPITPVKAKDPLKLVGQKSNIKLTLLNKSDKGPDPSPSVKRRLGELSSGAPPSKKQAIAPAKAVTADKIPKQLVSRSEKAKSPVKEKVAAPQVKSNKVQSSLIKQPIKTAPTQMAAPAPIAQPKQKKSNSSRREELLKQLKAVEDAIARKKSKMQ